MWQHAVVLHDDVFDIPFTSTHSANAHANRHANMSASTTDLLGLSHADTKMTEEKKEKKKNEEAPYRKDWSG